MRNESCASVVLAPGQLGRNARRDRSALPSARGSAAGGRARNGWRKSPGIWLTPRHAGAAGIHPACAPQPGLRRSPSRCGCAAAAVFKDPQPLADLRRGWNSLPGPAHIGTCGRTDPRPRALSNGRTCARRAACPCRMQPPDCGIPWRGHRSRAGAAGDGRQTSCPWSSLSISNNRAKVRHAVAALSEMFAMVLVCEPAADINWRLMVALRSVRRPTVCGRLQPPTASELSDRKRCRPDDRLPGTVVECCCPGIFALYGGSCCRVQKPPPTTARKGPSFSEFRGETRRIELPTFALRTRRSPQLSYAVPDEAGSLTIVRSPPPNGAGPMRRDNDPARLTPSTTTAPAWPTMPSCCGVGQKRRRCRANAPLRAGPAPWRRRWRDASTSSHPAARRRWC